MVAAAVAANSNRNSTRIAHTVVCSPPPACMPLCVLVCTCAHECPCRVTNDAAFLCCLCAAAVYDVTISRHPHCTCPDHAKGNLCKHILFVLLRVLKLSTSNPLVWQKALLTKEVRKVV